MVNADCRLVKSRIIYDTNIWACLSDCLDCFNLGGLTHAKCRGTISQAEVLDECK